jgi:selenide,water dikinase
MELPREMDPNLIVGQETSEDAGVYRLSGDLALIQTLDFFTPIVNDPYDFGRIAAANALSDVYAMGGRPLTAMNIVCFPIGTMDKEILKEILRGGLEKIHEAGAVLAGGHSVDDVELKYGLSVTGLVSPDKVWTNGGAQPGDALILTKPLGTGILATAIKAGLISPEAEKQVIDLMVTLNNKAAEVMSTYSVHACTDITGFGLLGHSLEMAQASKVTIAIEVHKVPVLSDVLDHAGMGLVPAGSYANRNFCASHVREVGSINPMYLDIIADAQTSGGLLIALAANEAEQALWDLKAAGLQEVALIGRVEDNSLGVIELK